MTLLEMSRQYTADAQALSNRIRQLQALASTTADPTQKQQLLQRIADLQPLLRQSRQLAQITAHYYDRGYTKHAQHQV